MDAAPHRGARDRHGLDSALGSNSRREDYGANIGFLDVSAVGEALLSAEASPIRLVDTFWISSTATVSDLRLELKQVFTLLRIEFGGLLSDDTTFLPSHRINACG